MKLHLGQMECGLSTLVFSMEGSELALATAGAGGIWESFLEVSLA
jgi:hypothetical protein